MISEKQENIWFFHLFTLICRRYQRTGSSTSGDGFLSALVENVHSIFVEQRMYWLSDVRLNGGQSSCSQEIVPDLQVDDIFGA